MKRIAAPRGGPRVEAFGLGRAEGLDVARPEALLGAAVLARTL